MGKKAKKNKLLNQQKLEQQKKEEAAALLKVMQAAAARKKFQKKVTIYTSTGLGAVTTVLVIFAVVAGHVYPKVTMGSVDIGFQPLAKAEEIMKQKTDEYLNNPITFVYLDHEVQVSAQEIGLKFSLTESILNIPTISLKGNPITLAQSIFQTKEYPVYFSVDSDKLIALLEQKFDFQRGRAQSAHFILNDKKVLEVAQDFPGEMIERKPLLAQLDQALNHLEPNKISINLIDESPTVTAAQLTPFKDKIAAKLKDPFTLMHDGRKWTIDNTKYLSAVRINFQSSIPLNNNLNDSFKQYRCLSIRNC